MRCIAGSCPWRAIADALRGALSRDESAVLDKLIDKLLSGSRDALFIAR